MRDLEVVALEDNSWDGRSSEVGKLFLGEEEDPGDIG